MVEAGDDNHGAYILHLISILSISAGNALQEIARKWSVCPVSACLPSFESSGAYG